MKKMSNATILLLVGIAVAFLSIFTRNILYLIGGVLAILISFVQCAKGLMTKMLAKSGRSYYPSFWLITLVGYILFVALSIVTTGFMKDWDLDVQSVLFMVGFSLLFSVVYTYLYFLPYLIANKREHLQTRAIYILNIFAGWTILAWLIALIWANTVQKENPVIQQHQPMDGADELKKYKELLDQQIISEEEFEAKKKQILGL